MTFFPKYFQQERGDKLKKSILLEKQKKMKDKLKRELIMHTGNKTLVIIAFLLVIALTVSGCSTTIKAYSRTGLTPNETSTIKPMNAFKHNQILNASFFKGLFGTFDPSVSHDPYITDIDGKKQKVGCGSKIVVEPGDHTLTVQILMSYVSRKTSISLYGPRRVLHFETEAGHTYHVFGINISKKGSIVWIEDAENQEVIAGRKPESYLLSLKMPKSYKEHQ
jgi:hypothetical protein